MFTSRQVHLPPEVATMAPGVDLLAALAGVDPRRLVRYDLGVAPAALAGRRRRCRTPPWA